MAPLVFWYGAPSLRRGFIWEESTELPWGGGADSEFGAEAEYSVVQRVGVGCGTEAKSSGAQEAGTGSEAGLLKAGEVGAEAGTGDVSLDSIEGAGIPEKGGIPGMGGGRAPPPLQWRGRAAGGKAPGAGGGGAAGGKAPGAGRGGAAPGAGGSPGAGRGVQLPVLVAGAILLRGPTLFFSSLCFSSGVSDILKALVPRGFVIPVQQEAYSLSSG